jgi:hypothetical protein
MKLYSWRIAPFLAVIGALALPALPGRAIVIDFDSGYSATGGKGGVGSLVGQSSAGTSWSGEGTDGIAAAILITAKDGVSGSDQSARTQAGDDAHQYTSYSFAPTDADLGAVFNAASSVINYSFQLKLNGTYSEATGVAFRLLLGGGKVVHFDLLDNGALAIEVGKGDGTAAIIYARTESPITHFRAPANTYVPVSGAINYATKTLTVTVNGVPQTLNGNANLGFCDPQASTAQLDIYNPHCHDPNWISTSIDNINLSAGPITVAPPVPIAPQPSPGVQSPAAVIPDGENMIKNPSFENPPATYLWQQNNWARNEVEFALDPDNPHSGKVSQRVGLKRVVGDRAALELNYPNVPVRPGMALKLSFWTRGPANTQPITVLIRKAHAPYTTYFQAEVALTDAWSQSSFNMVLPPNVDPGDTALMFTLKEENTFWLDDVSLAPFTPPEPPPLVGNQVANGSFEVGRDHWYGGFRESPDDGKKNAANIAAQAEKDAPNGKNVLAIEVPASCQLDLTSAYFPLRSGHPYSVRFWLKSPAAATPFNVSLGQGKFPNQVAESHAFASSDAQWDFYHFVVTPKPSGSGTYYLEFGAGRPGSYALDGVSVTEGESSDQAFPASATAELGWGSSPKAPAGNLFYPKDQISFPLEVAAAPGASTLPVRLRLVDYRERELSHWSVNVPLDQSGWGQTDVSLPADRFGGFKVEACLDGDAPDAIPRAELIYSVVPHLKPMREVKDSFFGAHVNLTSYNLDIAERLGMRWLRLHPPLSTKWMMVEPEKGKFDFYTEGAALAYNRGFHLLSLFDTAPWFYADADPVEAKKSRWYTSFAPADWDAWRTYVQKTATAFGPYIQNWEIWNEPDGGFLRVPPGKDKPTVYVKIVTETRKALDDAGMHFNLVGNAAADLNRPFTLQELKLGGGAQVDALSFHLYNEDRSPDEKKPPLADQLEAMRQFKNRSGAVPELWDTEGGIWLNAGRSWLRSARVPSSVSTTVADAASSVVRMNAALKAMGVHRYFYYTAMAEPFGRTVYRDECSGIIDVNGVPHAAGAAYAATVYFLEDASPIGLEVKPVGDGKVTLAKFQTSDSRITVLWTRTPLELEAIPGLDWKGASGFDMMGNPIDVSAQTKVTIDPIYLIVKGRTPASKP